MSAITNNLLFLFQIFGALVVCLCEFNLGTLAGYPTKALPQLRNETNTLGVELKKGPLPYKLALFKPYSKHIILLRQNKSKVEFI